jgi:hypothetical protein
LDLRDRDFFCPEERNWDIYNQQKRSYPKLVDAKHKYIKGKRTVSLLHPPNISKMQYSTVISVAVLCISTLASAVSIPSNANVLDCLHERDLKPKTLGATYFMTNKVENTIIISSIQANGELSFAREFPSGGAGAYTMNRTDPLFSQDSIIQAAGVRCLLCYQLTDLDAICRKCRR